MEQGQEFADFYGILQVHPECDATSLEAAYRRLAKMYHPDHPATADVERFTAVVGAYRALRSSEDRARYDAEYSAQTGFEFSSDAADPGERAALSDAEAHGRILKTLYQRRRESARDPGVGYYLIQQMLGCSDENLEFHVWYLKQKGLVETTEQGALAITIAGVDHVIGESRTAAREKLRITQGSGQPGVDGQN